MLAASDSLELNTDGAAGYPTKEGSGTFEKGERLRRTTRFNGSNPYRFKLYVKIEGIGIPHIL